MLKNKNEITELTIYHTTCDTPHNGVYDEMQDWGGGLNTQVQPSALNFEYICVASYTRTTST